MQRLLKSRFEVQKIFRNSNQRLSLIGLDRWNSKRSVFVKYLAASSYQPDTTLTNRLAWLHGLRHPWLATVDDAVLTPRRDLYITRAFVPGNPLTVHDSTSTPDLASAVLSACSLLQSAHIIHGRINPNNVIVRPGGDIVLVDAGLPATVAHTDATHLCFVAPEVLAGGAPTLESDLYSVGAVLYRIWSGSSLFEDSDDTLLRQKCLSAAPIPLSEISDIPKRIGKTIDALLAKQPQVRHAAFEELKQSIPELVRPANQAPYTGRDSELSRLLEGLKDRRKGLHITVLQGETGSGKTRMLEHLRFLRSLEGGLSIGGRSFERDNRPFEPILQAIGKRLNQADNNLERWRRTRSKAYVRTLKALSPDIEQWRMSDEEHPSLSRGQIVADLVGTIISLFDTDSSLILALDDVHWADEGTLEVLEQLSWRATDTTVRVLIASRSDDSASNLSGLLKRLGASPGTYVKFIPLQPLDSPAALEMARHLVLRDGFLSWVVDHSAGIPLLIEECAKYDSPPASLPRRMNDILLHQVTRLSLPQREAVQVISAFSRPIDPSFISKVFSTLPLRQPLNVDQIPLGSLLTRVQGKITFRHDGIRQAIYRSMSPPRRRRLHRLISSLLKEGDQDWALIAHHADRAGAGRDAVEAYTNAAIQSFRQDDFRTAIDLLVFAQAAGKRASIDLPVEARLTQTKCFLAIGKRKDAHNLLKENHGLQAKDAIYASQVETLLSSSCIDRPAECLQHSLAALQALPPNNAYVPRALLDLARAYALTGNVTRSKETLELADRCYAGRGGYVSDWCSARGLTLVALAEYSLALKTFSEYNRPGPSNAPIFSNRAVCYEHLGNLTHACKCQELALEKSREYGLLFGELLSLANLAAFHTKRGNFTRAQDLFEAACDFSERTRLYHGLAGAPLPLLSVDQAVLMMEQGNYGTARRLMATAVRQLRGDRTSQKAIWVAIKAAELYGRTQESVSAERALERVNNSELFHGKFFRVETALITTHHSADTASARLHTLEECLLFTNELGTLHQRCRILIELAATRIRLQETGQARSHLAQARQLASTHGYKPLGARVLLLEALTVDSAEKRLALLSRAHRQAAKIGLSELRAECELHVGQAHAEAGDLGPARKYLNKALDGIDAMSAGLPASIRGSYLRSGWRATVKLALKKLGSNTPNATAKSMRKRVNRRTEALPKLAYSHAVRVNRINGLDELILLARETVVRGMKADAWVFIDTPGMKELHTGGAEPDETTIREIRRLHKNVGHVLWIGHTSRALKRTPEASIVWMPLTFRHHKFGGIYFELNKSVTEEQIEFLTMIGINTSTALAALLWTADPPPVPPPHERHGGIVGRSAAIEGICAQIAIAAQSEATVLIEGESGTGKELVAHAIHDQSARSGGPFVAVDCGAIPETLIESEFFGSRKGSFTGATTDRVGLIESADGGTLFLDEISNTSPALQVKLLRVLQEREVRRLGDTHGRKVNIRLIVATNADLEMLVEQGEFRQDLLYRLKVLHIVIPPLRQRREDIADIAQAFLSRLNADHRTRKRFHKSALAALSQGPYRGNVRELQNIVERAYFSAVNQEVISNVHTGDPENAANTPDVDAWFKRLRDGNESFWRSVHAPYKSRDISREKVLALMDVGLRASRGSYRNLATMLNLKEGEYRRFMDFLRRNKCQLDFRPYRRGLREHAGA